MRKKIFKFAALVACIGILSLYVPGLLAVEKADKHDARNYLASFFKKPAVILSYFFPFLNPVFDEGKTSTPANQNSGTETIKKIKITGGTGSGAPSTGG
jgi:hypothetical protein